MTLTAAQLRWILAACVRLALPGCLPLVAAVLLLGLAAIVFGWWSALPAHLPGDELYGLQRVLELTLRTIFALPQEPDAPARAALTAVGVGLTLTGTILLLLGILLWVLRRPLQRVLMRSARRLRLVRVDDQSARWIAASASSTATVRLVPYGRVGWSTRHLTVALDGAFLDRTVPPCAPRVQDLLALDADSNVNLELARRVTKCRTATHQAPLEHLRVRIDSPQLRASVGREAEFASAAADGRLVSLPQIRCRQLLRAQPPNKVQVLGIERRPALAIVGLGDTGLEFFPRLCAQAQSSRWPRPVIVLVDTAASSITRQIAQSWPALALSVELHSVTLEARLPDSAGRLLATLRDRHLLPTSIFLALEERSLAEAWDSELGLAARTLGEVSPLVFSVIHPRGAPAESSLLAEDEALDALPRQLHESFLRAAIAPGPACVPWSQLSFEYQEDNRSAADHFWAKARDLNLLIVRGGSGDVSLPPELDKLAAAEHRRWCADRALFGWRVGPEHAEARHLNPALIPWSSLAEVERERERGALRSMPAHLAAGGFGLKSLIDLKLPLSASAREVAAILSAAHTAARQRGPNCVPHFVVAVEDAAGFELAEALASHTDVAVSLVLGQPLAGFALGAGRPAAAAAELTDAAWSVWFTRPDAVAANVNAWSALPLQAP